MKKAIMLFVIMALFSLNLYSCTVDLYSGKRPVEYENTKWISQHPDIYFEIGDKFSAPYGKINVNGMEEEITVLFGMGTQVSFYIYEYELSPYYSENLIIDGDCEFSKDKLVVKILKDYKRIFNDDIKEIIFIKQEESV